MQASASSRSAPALDPCRSVPLSGMLPLRREPARRVERSRHAFRHEAIGGASSHDGLLAGQAVVTTSHFTGTSAGAPLSLFITTRNVAGLVLLAFRYHVQATSAGPTTRTLSLGVRCP